jgi:DNA primase large subunit
MKTLRKHFEVVDSIQRNSNSVHREGWVYCGFSGVLQVAKHAA